MKDDANIFLNIAKDENSIGTMFSNKSIIFNKPLVIDTVKGKTEDFYFKLGAGDSAGNSVINEELFKLTIDRKPPVISDF